MKHLCSISFLTHLFLNICVCVLCFVKKLKKIYVRSLLLAENQHLERCLLADIKAKVGSNTHIEFCRICLIYRRHYKASLDYCGLLKPYDEQDTHGILGRQNGAKKQKSISSNMLTIENSMRAHNFDQHYHLGSVGSGPLSIFLRSAFRR